MMQREAVIINHVWLIGSGRFHCIRRQVWGGDGLRLIPLDSLAWINIRSSVKSYLFPGNKINVNAVGYTSAFPAPSWYYVWWVALCGTIPAAVHLKTEEEEEKQETRKLSSRPQTKTHFLIPLKAAAMIKAAARRINQATGREQHQE